MSRHTAFVALAAGMALSQAASAQWLKFADETSTRLQLSTVPLSDNQEKDLAAADLNKDGWTDIVVGRKTPFSFAGPRQTVLLMNENGVLVDRTAQYAPGFISKFADTRDVLIADFTGDGWLDVVLGTTFDDPQRFFRNLGNDGQGNWQGLADESSRFGPISTKPNKVCAIWAGDVTGNGALDIYFSAYNGGTDFIMINDGNGNFKDETAQRLGNYANTAFGTAVEIQDFDKDGHLDIIKCTTLFSAPPFGQGVFILWNDGNGKFNSVPFTTVPGTSAPYMVSTNDLNGNGTRDLYVVQDGQDATHLITVNGPKSLGFQKKTVSSPRTTGFGGDNKGAALENDGIIHYGVGPVDVDIQNCGSGKYALLKNDGTGQMSDPWPSSQSQNIHTNTWDFVFIDVNNDGCLDIVQGLCTGWRVFIREECPPQSCYADCDENGTLNIDDFLCFQLQFALQNPYADCDGNSLFNIDDFLCFQLAFALGC